MYIMGIYLGVNSLLTIIINSNYMYVVISPLKGGYITIITKRKKRCDFRCVFSGYVVIVVICCDSCCEPSLPSVFGLLTHMNTGIESAFLNGDITGSAYLGFRSEAFRANDGAFPFLFAT